MANSSPAAPAPSQSAAAAQPSVPGQSAPTTAGNSATAPAGAHPGGAQPAAGDAAAAAVQAARVVECVRVRTSAIADYRAGKLPKHLAISKCVSAIIKAGESPEALKDDIEAMDQHDRRRQAAAHVGAAQVAGQASGGGDPVSEALVAVTQRRKRALSAADSDPGSDAVSDDDTGRDKRGYDASAAGFKRAKRGTALSALVQETLRTRDNYLADPKRAKRDLLRDGHAPAFPDDLWEAVLTDRFVDFGKILSRRFATHVSDDTYRINDSMSVTLGTPRVIRSVTDQSDWNDAFSDWSAAVCHVYPHRPDELAAYRQFVTDLFRSTHKDEHRRVIAADAAIRCEVANNGALSFADTLRHRATADRFLSPYGTDSSLINTSGTPPAPPPAPSPSSSRWKPSGQICKNFNSNRCTHPQCRHAHVCDVCHSNSHSGTDHAAALDEPAASSQQ